MSCEVETELGISGFHVSFACAQHVFCSLFQYGILTAENFRIHLSVLSRFDLSRISSEFISGKPLQVKRTSI
jgi:hypothetical protein